jgi:hypothetical protein
MRLTRERSYTLLEKHGCYASEACDKCGQILRPVRFARRNDGGVWCSRESVLRQTGAHTMTRLEPEIEFEKEAILYLPRSLAGRTMLRALPMSMEADRFGDNPTTAGVDLHFSTGRFRGSIERGSGFGYSGRRAPLRARIR